MVGAVSCALGITVGTGMSDSDYGLTIGTGFMLVCGGGGVFVGDGSDGGLAAD